jgi:hypothetical protein
VVDYVIRIFQDFDGDEPTLKSARGGVKGDLGNTADEAMAQPPLELKLQDGRKVRVLFTEPDGTFQVTPWNPLTP